jgi:hypothetical protein
MVNWLTKASRQTVDAPQEFQLTCECGQAHRGQRKSKPQRIICQACGAALFVLPRNVYPVLKPLKPKHKRRKGRAGRGDEPPSMRSLAGDVGRTAAGAARGIGRSLHSAGGALRRRTGDAARQLWAAVRAQLTPFRLVLCGIIALLLATLAWTVQAHRLEQAREILRTELDAGEEALRAEDAVSAQKHFASAVAAADLLGTPDARSRQARQMLLETTAMTRLAPVSLFDMLDEAEAIVSGERPELWETHFRAHYADTWIVLEAPISLSSTSEGTSSVIIDVPLLVGEQWRTVQMTAAVPDVAQLGLSEQPQPAIFAGALIGCELDAAQEKWLVRLRSEQGFLWSNIDNLRTLGYFASDAVSEDETRKLLERQTKAIGL